MVIQSTHHYGLVVDIKQKGEWDFFFEKEPYIKLYDSYDPYYGATLSAYDPEEMVTVILGERREKIIYDIKQDLHQKIKDTRADLNTINTLIKQEEPNVDLR